MSEELRESTAGGGIFEVGRAPIWLGFMGQGTGFGLFPESQQGKGPSQSRQSVNTLMSAFGGEGTGQLERLVAMGPGVILLG